MGYKVMVALIVLLLLVCNSTQVYSEVSSMVELQKSLSMAYPAASCYGPLDEPHSASLAVDNEITSRKLLRGVGRRLREEKLSSAESRSENSRWTTRILHHLGQSASHALHKVWHSENGIASHQFSGASLNQKSSENEQKSLAPKQIKSVSRHRPGEIHEQPNFHVDYSGPQTHKSKHH